MKSSLALTLLLSLSLAGTPFHSYAQTPGDVGDSLILDDATGKVRIDFDDVSITLIIDAIAKLTGKNFIYDDRVRGKVTIISPVPVDVEEAWAVFESVLKIKGFTAVPGPAGVFKVVPVRDAKESNIETIRGNQRSPNRDQYVTRMIPLYYIDAQAISSTLKPLISKDASMVLYAPTNTIILTDTRANIGRLLGILEALDVETHKEELAVIKVLYADAKTLGNQISNIYGGSASGGAATASAARKARSSRRSKAGSSKGGSGGLQAVQRREVRIITENRTNSLIILASRSQISEIRALVRKLDVPVVGGGKIHVYYLNHADAQEMAKTLTSLVGGGGRRGGGRTGKAGAAGGTQALRSVVTPLAEGRISLSADPGTNSLVIQASKEAYETLVQVIHKLDVPRPQVLVEALIMEIDITDGFALGFDFGYMAVNNNINWDVSGADLVGGAVGGFASIVKSSIDFDDNGDPVEGDTGSQISASMSAAAADNRVKILSAPHILTSDNEEAEIRIGDNIPIVSARHEGTSNSNNNGISTSIDRKDIGVTLRVTPQISDGDTFRLKIFLEITEINTGLSAAVSGGDAGNVTDIGVALSNRRVENTVVVADGDTVVIGGLIGEVASDVEAKVPFFGDIPLLGWLFKSVSKDVRRTNLVIFLTPTMVRSPQDLERETILRRQEFARATRTEEALLRLEADVLAGNLDISPGSLVEERLLDHQLRYPIDRMSQIEEDQRTDRANTLALREAELHGPRYEVRAILHDDEGASQKIVEIVDLGYDAQLVTSDTEQGIVLEIIVGPFPSRAQANSTVVIMQRAMSLDPYVVTVAPLDADPEPVAEAEPSEEG